MGKTILILGGGWGGLSVAHRLRGYLGQEHRIVIIEKSDKFSLGPSNLWVMTGDRKYPEDVERSMLKLLRKDIECLHGEVTGIETETKKVHTSVGTLTGDYLVIALGSELYPESLPGFVENAYNLYDLSSVVRLHESLQQFTGGKIIVFCSSTPFRCPPAPYEAALLIESLFRNRGLKDKTEVHIYTPEKQPMPVGGPKIGAMLRRMIENRGIKYHPEHKIIRIDGTLRKIFFQDGIDAKYDLLIGVPPHHAPRIVVEAGLTDSTGYIPTHPQTMRILDDVETLETKLPGIYVLGDIAAITLLNSMLLPKAGVFAEEQASVIAGNIAALIRGEESSKVFDGKGICYIETGDGMASTGSGEFYAYPEPRILIESPSKEGHKAKEELEKLLTTWFA